MRLHSEASRGRARRWKFVAAALVLGGAVPVTLLLALDLYAHSRLEKTGGVNIWGYRGPIAGRKAPGETRIVMLGGSTAFGYGAAWNDAIPARLAARLNAIGRGPFSVVNLAYNNEGAYSFQFTARDYLYLDYDIAILYEGYNDMLGDGEQDLSVFRRNSPVFRMTGYLPILPVVLREKAAATLYKGDIDQLYIGVRAGRQKAVFDASLADRAKAGALNATAAVSEAIERELGTLSPDTPRVITGAEASGCRSPWREYCHSMFTATDLLLAHDKRVLVVTQPYLPARLRARHMDQQAAMSTTLLKRYAGNARVRYYDAGPAVDLGDPSLAYDGMHLTPPGNARVADALVQPVLQLLGSK